MPSTRDFNAEAREQTGQVAAHIPALQRAYARGIRKLGRRATANFVRLTAKPNAALTSDASEPSWSMPDLDELFTIQWGTEVLERETRAARLRMVASATGVWADELEPAVRGRITGDILVMLGQRITETTEHVRDHAGVMLRQGLDEGWGVEKTAAHLSASFPEFSRNRGMLIARTETIGASNAGSLSTAQATGAATHKVWLARMDSRTRPTHAEANGQSVRIDEPFAVDGVLMQYPGAEGAPAAEVCNCRCTIIYDNPEVGNVPPIIADGDREAIIAAAFAELPARVSVPGVLRFVTLAPEPPTAKPAAGDDEPDGDEEPTTDDAPDDADGDEPARTRFEMLLIPLAHPTSDGRMIDPAEPGAVAARELPLSLMAQFETPEFGGHAGAVIAGRIDSISEGDASSGGFTGRAILATGVYDDADGDQGTDDGRQAARMARDGMLRGVSADIAPSEMELRTAEGEPIDPDDEEALMEAMFGNGIMAVTRGEIMGATQVPFPAFSEAAITVVASLEHRHALLAAAAAGEPAPPEPAFELLERAEGVLVTRAPSVSLDQVEAYRALVDGGLATENEVRSWLGLSGVSGGDVLRASGGRPDTPAPRLVAAAGGFPRRVRAVRDEDGRTLRYERIAEEEAV